MRCTSPCRLRGPGSVELGRPRYFLGAGFSAFCPAALGSPCEDCPRPPAGPARESGSASPRRTSPAPQRRRATLVVCYKIDRGEGRGRSQKLQQQNSARRPASLLLVHHGGVGARQRDAAAVDLREKERHAIRSDPSTARSVERSSSSGRARRSLRSVDSSSTLTAPSPSFSRGRRRVGVRPSSAALDSARRRGACTAPSRGRPPTNPGPCCAAPAPRRHGRRRGDLVREPVVGLGRDFVTRLRRSRRRSRRRRGGRGRGRGFAKGEGGGLEARGMIVRRR